MSKNEAREAAIAARGEKFIEALKAERATLRQRGLTDRVKEVDAQIKAYGGGTRADADEVTEAPSGTPATTADTKPTTTR